MQHALRKVGIEPRTSGYQALRSANCTTSPINLIAPRVYLFTGGAGARWAGPDELFLGSIFEKIGVCTCLATATEWARMGGAQCAQCTRSVHSVLSVLKGAQCARRIRLVCTPQAVPCVQGVWNRLCQI